MSDTHVYFIKPVGMMGPIKIGCSKLPMRRLRDLMTWSPIDLELIHSLPGDFSTERRIHDCFWNDHLRHEWFTATPRIVDAIAKIKAGTPIAEAIDFTAKDRSGEGGMRFSPERRVYLSYTHRVEWVQRKLSGLGVEASSAPADVGAIMARWSGFNLPAQVSPTSDELMRLDAYLADPMVHSVIPAWRVDRLPQHQSSRVTG